MITKPEISELINESKCYGCYGPLSLMDMISIALMRRILLSRNPSADTSPGALIAYGACNFCLPVDVPNVFEMSLLDQISNS